MENQGGGFNVKLPKVRKYLDGWPSYIAFDICCALPHMFHPIIMGVSRWMIGYIQPTCMCEPKGLHLGEIGAGWLVYVHSKMLIFEKWQYSRNARFKIT